jgi:hypothetical protein
MRLYVKITLLRPGTAEPAGPPKITACPPDVEPDTIRSFLILSSESPSTLPGWRLRSING